MVQIENRTYTQDELEHFGIMTGDYKLNLEPGFFCSVRSARNSAQQQ